MKVDKKSLQLAAQEGIITKEQGRELYALLGSLPSSSPVFSFTNVLYYMGGLVAIRREKLINNNYSVT